MRCWTLTRRPSKGTSACGTTTSSSCCWGTAPISPSSASARKLSRRSPTRRSRAWWPASRRKSSAPTTSCGVWRAVQWSWTWMRRFRRVCRRTTSSARWRRPVRRGGAGSRSCRLRGNHGSTSTSVMASIITTGPGTTICRCRSPGCPSTCAGCGLASRWNARSRGCKRSAVSSSPTIGTCCRPRMSGLPTTR